MQMVVGGRESRTRSGPDLSRQVAAKFSSGLVFLIGDAAHRFPPNGGFGMNSGIQDAHNLAWKLKFVFDGSAGSGLLDTYDMERRPVAESNADFSLGNQKRFLPTSLSAASLALRISCSPRLRSLISMCVPIQP
jgi:2-polyprenyl-6-methoxyphenol hydroxylase-like FAD-dependent oxidoreductase